MNCVGLVGIRFGVYVCMVCWCVGAREAVVRTYEKSPFDWNEKAPTAGFSVSFENNGVVVFSVSLAFLYNAQVLTMHL